MDCSQKVIGVYGKLHQRVGSLVGQPRIASLVDGGCLLSDSSLPSWIGPDSEASSLAHWRCEFQNLVMEEGGCPIGNPRALFEAA